MGTQLQGKQALRMSLLRSQGDAGKPRLLSTAHQWKQTPPLNPLAFLLFLLILAKPGPGSSRGSQKQQSLGCSLQSGSSRSPAGRC